VQAQERGGDLLLGGLLDQRRGEPPCTALATQKLADLTRRGAGIGLLESQPAYGSLGAEGKGDGASRAPA
jgi:hypothetical protein